MTRPGAPTATVLRRMGETGLLPESERMIAALALYSGVLQIMSAALLHPFREESWSTPFKDLLARLTHFPDFSRLEAELATMEAEVSAAAAHWYERAGAL